MHLKRRGLAVGSAVSAAALVASGGIAAATSASTPPQMYACYNTHTGVMRFAYASSKCSKEEMKIKWNQQGPVGPQGLAGDKGEPGKDGPAGKDGAVGPDGPAGKDGAPGKDGAVGPEGPRGPQGPSGGEQGVKGDKGDKGDTGAPGATGDTGAPGTPGKDGKDGKDATRLWAVVGADGATVQSSGDVSVSVESKGVYLVKFTDHDVSTCSSQATRSAGPGYINIDRKDVASDTVRVVTYNVLTLKAAAPFDVATFCGPVAVVAARH